MDTLFLRFTVDNGLLQVEPTLRDNLGGDAYWGVRPGDLQEAKRLSDEIHRLLQQGVHEVSTTLTGSLPLGRAKSKVNQIRQLGRELRNALLHDDVIQLIEQRPSIDHMVFKYMPSLGGIAFEQMFFDDFIGFQFATGRELISDKQEPPLQRPDHDGSYKGALIVDPRGLICDVGVEDLLNDTQSFLEGWSDNDQTAAKIRFATEQALVCCPVTKDHIKQALLTSDIFSILCHHEYCGDAPGRSGFLLKESAGDDPPSLFTAEDLHTAILKGDTPPSLVFAVACDSAITKAWEEDWPHRHHELYGMVDAMLQVRVRHYISAVAEVPANGSPRIIELFHQKLAEGLTVGRALQETRKALRTGPDGKAVPGGDILGLAFVLFGDPWDAYFCPEGHRVDTEPVRCCTKPLSSGGICGRIVCPAEDGFNSVNDRNHPSPRCNIHFKRPQRPHCAAGHAVDSSEQLKTCKTDGCEKKVCPECDGWDQRCWEHFSHSGHEIIGNVRKTCSDRFGLHPQQRRTVHPLDDGWMWGLCDDCWQHRQQNDTRPPSCSHCGRNIDETNDWSGVCDDCGKRLCENCSPWYESTMYCPCPNNTRDEDKKNIGWFRSLERRGQDDVTLAMPASLKEKGALASTFRKNVGANVIDQTGRLDPMPRLRLSAWDVVVPESRVLLGVTQSDEDLSQRLYEALQSEWNLPVEPGGNDAWQPPSGWLKAYRPTVQLNVLRLRSLWGRPVVAAVATVTPVEWKPGNGPTLVPCAEDHLKVVEKCLGDWWAEKMGRVLPDTYLVVFSSTGWASKVDPTYQSGASGLLRVHVEHQGNDWRVAPPPLDGMASAVQDFVGRLVPQSIYQQRQEIREQVEEYLKDNDFITQDNAEKRIEAQTGRPVQGQSVERMFDQLVATGKYRRGDVNGKLSLRLATPQERVGRLARRWWLGGVASLLVLVIALLGAVLPFFYEYRGSVTIGVIACVLSCQILGHTARRFLKFLRQT